jgi:hypothetical protein
LDAPGSRIINGVDEAAFCQSSMPVGHLSKPKSFIPFTLNFLKEFYRFARPEELPCCSRSYAQHER